MISENLTSYLNPDAWNEVSNMLFLSQPVGTGFSYAEEEVGSIDPITGFVVNASVATPDGRYSIINPYKTDTTDLAAVATWHILQGFLANLPQLDGLIKPKKFNLWTESYGMVPFADVTIFYSLVSSNLLQAVITVPYFSTISMIKTKALRMVP